MFLPQLFKSMLVVLTIILMDNERTEEGERKRKLVKEMIPFHACLRFADSKPCLKMTILFYFFFKKKKNFRTIGLGLTAVFWLFPNSQYSVEIGYDSSSTPNH